MATLLSQKLDQYYEKYKDKEIAFNKSVMNITGLEPKKIFLKIKGDDIHCIVYSCSMSGVKILVNLTQKDFENIRIAKNMVSVRFSFINREKKDSIVFFISGNITSYKNFETKNNNLYLVSIAFIKKPPEDLIEILGRTIEISENIEKRKDVRVELTSETLKEIGLLSNSAHVSIEGVIKNCIIKDISFSGALIIFQSDNLDFLKNKKIALNLRTFDNQLLLLNAEIVRCEFIADRKDIVFAGIQFNIDNIPSSYKEMLNNYFLKQEQKKNQNTPTYN
ncbi:MAG TPA: PilZ domain-containing protein [Spirochaetota bacterium]|nr:PilZ domain-containing protein [Spirochaetota bacterium]HOL57318.1 PilZ domain-containing protein [Spirochaetota bacterium]HPP04924.1 PilZ domain-containing protein [Spirochaetota bacterium]